MKFSCTVGNVDLSDHQQSVSIVETFDASIVRHLFFKIPRTDLFNKDALINVNDYEYKPADAYYRERRYEVIGTLRYKLKEYAYNVHFKKNELIKNVISNLTGYTCDDKTGSELKSDIFYTGCTKEKIIDEICQSNDVLWSLNFDTINVFKESIGFEGITRIRELTTYGVNYKSSFQLSVDTNDAYNNTTVLHTGFDEHIYIGCEVHYGDDVRGVVTEMETIIENTGESRRMLHVQS